MALDPYQIENYKMAQRGINKVILIGNLGNDPDCKYMPSGGAATNITIATSETWKDKQTGQPQERTEWHRVVFFNRLAEVAGEYLRKGSKVYIEGSLRTRKWQDQSGQDKYTTEIVAKEMQMLDSRNTNPTNQGNREQAQPGRNSGQQGGGYQDQSYSQAPAQQAHRRAPARQAAPQQAPQAPAGGFDDFDDDIPF